MKGNPLKFLNLVFILSFTGFCEEDTCLLTDLPKDGKGQINFASELYQIIFKLNYNGLNDF